MGILNNLTIGGFVMRNLEEIRTDIEKTREQLRDLYKEERDATRKRIDLDTSKLYIFKDPEDNDIEYCGKIYDYWFYSDGEYIFDTTGLQRCFCDIRDSCWSSFDGKYQIMVRPEKLDEFLRNIREITEEEFSNYILEWQLETNKWLTYWINTDFKEDDDSKEN